MKNVTISMDEELLRQVRIKAAEHGVSVSKFFGQLAKRETDSETVDESGLSPAQKAVRKILEKPHLNGILDEVGKAPSYDERHDR